jgi:hypothetical protein
MLAIGIVIMTYVRVTNSSAYFAVPREVYQPEASR